MATTYKVMKTFTRPDGDDYVQYEIVDENGRKMIAPNWYEHEDDAFTVGQHIEKDGVLYRFTSAHTAGDAWDDEEVTEITVTDEIQAIKSDVSGKASKVSGATSGHFAGLDANGNPTDSGYSVGTGSPSDSKLWTSQQTFSHMSNFLALKADKVTGATENNFAALDANGNLKDSGKKPSDFLTEHQDISGKADKDTDAIEGNFAAFDSNGNPVDSGHKHSDYLTSHQDISGKADKVTGGTADNLAALDASGNLKDSGTSVTDLMSAIQQKADIIRDSVTNVPIATVPDGAAVPLSALKIAVEPVQDLHGYDNPWPAGGRANLLDLDKASYNPLAYGLTVTRDGDGVKIAGTATQTGNLAFNLITDYSGETLGGKGYVLQVFDVTSGYTVNSVWGFRTESEKAFAIGLTGITEGQVVNCSMKLSVAETSQTSWSPYSNICPITGWTGCNLFKDGANLLANEMYQYSTTQVRLGITESNARYLHFKAGTYTLTINSSASATAYCLPQGGSATRIGTNGSNGGTFTLDSDGNYVFYAYKSGGLSTTDITSFMLELGSTAHAYTPFVGTVYPISWQTEAGTVYGGEVDAVNGVVKKTMQIADIGDMSWNYNSTYGIMSVSLEQGKSTTAESLLCSVYKYGGYNVNNSEMASAPDKTIWKRFGNGLTQNATAIYIKDSDYTDKDVFKTAMKGQTICYELETTIEIPLSDLTPIKTLKGQNNLWADCGNILLMEYGCDTKGYIEKRLSASKTLMELIVTANRESEMKASKAYTSGNLLIVNGTLYRATTSIANGATLTVGTNVTATTVAAELAALA